MEGLAHSATKRFAVYSVEAFQHSEEIIKKLVADEAIVNKAVVLLACATRIGPNSHPDKRRLKTVAASHVSVDPNVEVAMNHPARSELPVDFEERVLCMRFQQKAAFANNLAPTFDDWDENFVDHERHWFSV